MKSILVPLLILGSLALAQPAGESPASDAEGILIEAEAFADKVSASEDFADPAFERFASGQRTLARFFYEGHVLYRFNISAEATYHGWLRYGSKGGPKLRVALDPGQKPAFEARTLPPTGGYIGEGVWGWVRLFTAPLAHGEHTLAIGSGSYRLDCIYITRADQPPDDEVIHLGPPKLDAQTQALLAKPLVAVRPDWLEGAAEYRLPAWYDGCRVQAHTRLSLRWMEEPIFLSAAEAFREMGCRAYTRHIKTGKEGAWWPSEVGAVLPEVQERNWAQAIIDNAHANDCHIIVYHRHMEDAHMAGEHPDWVCRNHNGKPLSSSRGDYMCFNSPYAEYFLTRALELVDMGADGFYFDEAHMPKSGCWCDYCRKRFKAETGLDHPAHPDANNPIWHKLIDFNNATIERTFLKWREAIHQRNPGLVMLIGSNTWPAMTERHLHSRLFRIADSMKTEFSLPARVRSNAVLGLPSTMRPFAPDAKLALGYTLARDAADGRPAHIWTHNLLTETSALFATAGVVAHGSIANLDISEGTLPNPMFNKAFELGERISPCFADTAPLRWALLHYPENARDAFAISPQEAWAHVLYPFYGAYEALLRQHLPVGIITDSQLEEGRLDEVGVLFLPAPHALTEPMQKAVNTFRERGGLVIEQNPAWKWHESAEAFEQARQAFIASLDAIVPRAPVRVSGGPEKMHSVSFRSRDRKRLVVALANDFSWVHTGRIEAKDREKRAKEEAGKVPSPCEGVQVTVLGAPPGANVVEAVSGASLGARGEGDLLKIDVPTFEYLAAVVVEPQQTGE